MAEAPGGEILVYEAPDGGVRVDVRLHGETVWLSLTQMAELFGRNKSVISRHLRNVFRTGELGREATVAKNATVQREGDPEVVREIDFGGEPLYASAQARAAHLLYFVIKDHPFGDGNKRIGTLLFLEYLRRNGLLASADGSPRLPTTRSSHSHS